MNIGQKIVSLNTGKQGVVTDINREFGTVRVRFHSADQDIYVMPHKLRPLSLWSF